MKATDSVLSCQLCDSDELSSRLVADWKGVRLISDANPVIPGHLLGVSKTHCLSFGEMNVAYLTTLRDDVVRVSKLLLGSKSKVILFERGNKLVNKSGKLSIDHAHFHLIPTEDISKYLPDLKQKANFLDLPKYVQECSYYFYWDVLEDIAYWGNSESVESQFIRKVIAIENDAVNWDWKSNPSENGHAKEQSMIFRDILKGA